MKGIRVLKGKEKQWPLKLKFNLLIFCIYCPYIQILMIFKHLRFDYIPYFKSSDIIMTLMTITVF